MSKITNKDIAAMAGVSPAAVSLAIHGKKGVSDETRARILNAVRQTHYSPPTRTVLQPNADTVILATGPHPGHIPPDLLTCLLDWAASHGAELRIYTQEQLMADYPARLAGCRLLVALDEIEPMTLDLLSTALPRILILDGDRAGKPYCNIRLDYAGAAGALMAYLMELGHRNFVYLNRDLPANKNLLAFSGFQRHILKQHLPLDPAQIIMDAAADAHVWTRLTDILHQRSISAVLCTSDGAAVETVCRLTAAGIRVPEDVSVAAVTADRAAVHPGFSLTHAGLNTSRMPAEIRRLLDGEETDEARDVVIPAAAVTPGGSTAAPSFDTTTKKLAIALILKDHPSYRVVRAGFLNSVRHLGYQAEVVGVADTDEDAYRRVCQTLPALGADGVVLWLPLPDVIESFRDLGLPVVCPHSICRDGAAYGIRANIAAPPEQTAEHVAEFFAARLAGRRGVVAVSRTSEAEQESALTRHFIRSMARLCPNVTVQSDLLFVNHTEENTRLVMDYVRQSPDLLGAYTTAGEACVTWAAAKKALGRENMIIVGTDYTDETLDLLEAGEVQAFVAQPLYEEAQSSAVALDKILRGSDLPYFTALDAPLVTRDTMGSYRRLLQDVKNWYA